MNWLIVICASITLLMSFTYVWKTNKAFNDGYQKGASEVLKEWKKFEEENK